MRFSITSVPCRRPVSRSASSRCGGDGSDGSALSSLGVKPLSVPASGRFSDFARAHAGQFDLVYLHRVETAMRCLKLARRYFDAQIIYSVADLHHLRLQAQSRLDTEHASELMRQGVSVRAPGASCCALGRLGHHPFCSLRPSSSNNCRASLRRESSRSSRGPCRQRRCDTAFADRSGLAFIGSFAHAPNVDAARWLVNEIMPLVWRRRRRSNA